MNTLLDIMLSMIVGALLLTMLVGYNADLMERGYVHTMHLSVQEKALAFREILEADLKLTGLGMPDSTVSFMQIDTNRVHFLADVDRDGSVDTVRYYTGGTADFTENPADMFIFRQVDTAEPERFSVGALSLRFKYYTDAGAETANTSAVRRVWYSLYMENETGYNGRYPGVFIKGVVRPRNIG